MGRGGGGGGGALDIDSPTCSYLCLYQTSSLQILLRFLCILRVVTGDRGYVLQVPLAKCIWMIKFTATWAPER
jgi:hypothetical protein